MPIYTGSDLKADTTLECDVCIVGSGAGGAHVAQRVAKAGKRVIVLEEGGFHTSSRFDGHESSAYRKLYQEGGARATTDQSMTILQGRAVGGTTVVNWTTCFRTPKRVFDHWHEHHAVEGISYDALVPHWEEIERRLHVTQMKLEQVNKNNLVTWRGAQKLGWHAGLLHRNVKHCAHSGLCGMGCPIDAKQSMLVTMLPEAVDAGADVYANAWVERITREKRKCTSVVARMRDPESDKPNGITLTVKAKVTVLAGGAINTPALLLRSQVDANGRTGMRTYFHPALAAVGVHAERIDPFAGSPQYVHSEQFVERGPDQMSFLIEGGPIFPILFGSHTPAFGREKQSLLDITPYLSNTLVLMHDGFDLDNHDEGAMVTLRDGGLPRVDYKWTPRLIEGMKAGLAAGLRIQLAAGAKQALSGHPYYLRSEADIDRFLAEAPFEPNKLPVGVAHVMGGCPMGTRERLSIVDSRTMRHHGFDNMFVIDGSVFPTSITVNPQLSIYGLASWASQFVVQAA
jgi:choline dehydrogenase-like flavoprotein